MVRQFLVHHYQQWLLHLNALSKSIVSDTNLTYLNKKDEFKQEAEENTFVTALKNRIYSFKKSHTCKIEFKVTHNDIILGPWPYKGSFC